MCWFICPKCKHIIKFLPCDNCGYVIDTVIRTSGHTEILKEVTNENRL